MQEGLIFGSADARKPVEGRTSLEAKTKAEDIFREASVASIPDRDHALLAAMIATGSRIDALVEVLRNPIKSPTGGPISRRPSAPDNPFKNVPTLTPLEQKFFASFEDSPVAEAHLPIIDEIVSYVLKEQVGKKMEDIIKSLEDMFKTFRDQHILLILTRDYPYRDPPTNDRRVIFIDKCHEIAKRMVIQRIFPPESGM